MSDYGPITNEELDQFKQIELEEKALRKLMDELIARHKDLERIREEWWMSIRERYAIRIEHSVQLDSNTRSIAIIQPQSEGSLIDRREEGLV